MVSSLYAPMPVCSALKTFLDKAVLEPCVSPAFAITYFCNHCNIRFENTSKYVDTLTFFPKTWTKDHWPLDDLWPHVCWGHMCDSTQGSLCPSPMTIHQCMYSDQFCKIPHTYTYIHTTYYVQNEWSHSLLLNSVQARQKVNEYLFCYTNEKNYTIHTQMYMWYVPFVKHKSKQPPFSDRLSDLYTLCMHKKALCATKVTINVNYYSFTSFCFQANFTQICRHALITLPENMVVICQVVLHL